jgi:hypothetical protein
LKLPMNDAAENDAAEADPAVWAFAPDAAAIDNALAIPVAASATRARLSTRTDPAPIPSECRYLP